MRCRPGPGDNYFRDDLEAQRTQGFWIAQKSWLKKALASDDSNSISYTV